MEYFVVQSQDACRTCKTCRTCSGKGDCKKNARGLDVCECRLYGPDGYPGYINQGGKPNHGNWCQCNPGNCEPENSNFDFFYGKVEYIFC